MNCHTKTLSFSSFHSPFYAFKLHLMIACKIKRSCSIFAAAADTENSAKCPYASTRRCRTEDSKIHIFRQFAVWFYRASSYYAVWSGVCLSPAKFSNKFPMKKHLKCEFNMQFYLPLHLSHLILIRSLLMILNNVEEEILWKIFVVLQESEWVHVETELRSFYARSLFRSLALFASCSLTTSLW